jgi:hypothetical protein
LQPPIQIRLASFDHERFFEPTPRLTGSQGEARRRGPLKIHAAFIDESAIHARAKVQ